MSKIRKAEKELLQIQNQIGSLQGQADNLKDYIQDLKSRELRPYVSGFMSDREVFNMLMNAKPDQDGGDMGVYSTEDGKRLWISYSSLRDIVSDAICIYLIRPRPKEQEGQPAPIICKIENYETDQAKAYLKSEYDRNVDLSKMSMLESALFVLSYRMETGESPEPPEIVEPKTTEEVRKLDI